MILGLRRPFIMSCSRVLPQRERSVYVSLVPQGRHPSSGWRRLRTETPETRTFESACLMV